MVEAATAFRKNGFNDEDSANLAQVAVMFTNVADEAVTASESADMIIAQLIAFGLEAEDAMTVIDQINELSNQYSVSSGDLADSLGIVASTSAAMGNSMSETMAMMVAITEQTRSANRSARGLNSIFSRLSQILDDNSSTGAALIKIYTDLGIELYELDGQMRSTFDILTDLAEVWDTLSVNEQRYIALTSAGTNQLNNFLALMNNFDHAIEGNEVALNAAGSAARENERAMESLSMKVNALKATFEDLSNNVIQSDLVKSLLDLANGFLSLLNTGIGPTIVQFTLLSTALTGFITILASVGGHLVGTITNFKNLASAATGLISGLKGIATGGAAAATGIKAVAAAAGPVAIGIAAVVTAIQLVSAAVDHFTVTVEEQRETVAQLESELDSLGTEYQELYDKQQSDEGLIASEERRLELLKQQLAIKQQLYQMELQQQVEMETDPYNEGALGIGISNMQAYNNIANHVNYLKEQLEDLGIITSSNAEEADKLTDSILKYQEEMLAYVENMNESAQALEEFKEQGIDIGDEAERWLEQYDALIKYCGAFGIALGDVSDEIDETKKQIIDLKDYTKEVAEQFEGIGKQSAVEFTSGLEKLDEAYQVLQGAAEEYNSTGHLTAATLSSLANLSDDYSEALEFQNGKLTVNLQKLYDMSDALMKEAIDTQVAAAADEIWNVAMNTTITNLEDAEEGTSSFKDELINFDTVVRDAALGTTKLAEGALAVDAAMSNLMPDWVGMTENQRKAVENILGNLKSSINETVGIRNAFSFGSGKSSSSGSSSKATDPLEAQKDLYKEQNELIEWKIELMEKEGASAEELAQAWKDYQTTLKEQEQWYRDQGLDETSEYVRDTIDAWHDAQDEIESIGKDSLDELISQTEDYISDRKDLTEMGAAEEYEIWKQLLAQIDELQKQGLVSYEYYIEQRQEILHEMLVLQKKAAEEAAEAAEEAREAYIEQLEDKQDVYEKFFSYMTDRIQDEIDALEEEREAEEEYWDAKIDALQEQNDEIERQIQLEQLQAALAASRQSRVMVYKDGRFQYIQDIDEISEAQANLESYQREEALRQEVENLEKLKEQALETLDQQIEAWEEYKEQWSSVVDHYQEEQDRLLIEQELGIELEGDLWKERLDNLESYVSQYEALMARLSAAANMSISIGGGGGSSSGGNRYPVGEGAHGGVTNNDGTWSPFPGGPVYSNGVSVSGSASGGRGSSSDGGSGSREGMNFFEWGDNKGTPSRDNPDYDMYYYLVDNGAPSDVILGEQYRVESGLKDRYTDKKHARGTLNAPEGISLVGEEGPELRVLNQGDGIIPADVTKNLWSWGEMSPYDFMNKVTAYQTMGGKTITNTIENLNISLPNVKNGEEFAQYCKENLWRTAVQKEAV